MIDPLMPASLTASRLAIVSGKGGVGKTTVSAALALAAARAGKRVLLVEVEQRQAIAASGGLPIQFEDPETHKLYVLIEQRQDLSLMDEDYIRDEVSKGIAALDAGQRIAWDPERIKQEGRRRFAARKAPE